MSLVNYIKTRQDLIEEIEDLKEYRKRLVDKYPDSYRLLHTFASAPLGSDESMDSILSGIASTRAVKKALSSYDNTITEEDVTELYTFLSDYLPYHLLHSDSFSMLVWKAISDDETIKIAEDAENMIKMGFMQLSDDVIKRKTE